MNGGVTGVGIGGLGDGGTNGGGAPGRGGAGHANDILPTRHFHPEESKV